MRRPSRFPRGLGPRERLLATIDSLSAESYFAWRRGRSRTGLHGSRRRSSTVSTRHSPTGVRRYPNDAELWFLLGRARVSRIDSDVDRWARSTIARSSRCTIARSRSTRGFAPAYVTPISLAAYLDGAASARRYIRAYLALAPSGPRSEIIRLADVLLDPDRALVDRRRASRRHVAARSPVRGDDVAASRSRRG